MEIYIHVHSGWPCDHIGVETGGCGENTCKHKYFNNKTIALLFHASMKVASTAEKKFTKFSALLFCEMTTG